MYIWIVQWYTDNGPTVEVYISEANANRRFRQVRNEADSTATIGKVQIEESKVEWGV